MGIPSRRSRSGLAPVDRRVLSRVLLGVSALEASAWRRSAGLGAVPEGDRSGRVRASAVARRRDQLSRCLKERETKGDGGTFCPAFSPIIDAPQAPEITAAKPSSPLPTHTADVTTPRVVQEVRVGRWRRLISFFADVLSG